VSNRWTKRDMKPPVKPKKTSPKEASADEGPLPLDEDRVSVADLPRIRVVAAVIARDGQYLITQRKPSQRMPLLWEFPGGRVEENETDAVALARELAEEMAIAVHVGDELFSVKSDYPDYVIDFHVYWCELLSEDVRTIGVHDYRWVTSDELDQYPFPAVDQETVNALLEDQ
jgi:8-oxo-dGTP diphosphatase